jgi:hypothetical protein
MSIRRCVLVALSEEEALARGVEIGVFARLGVWTSLAEVLPPDGVVLARLGGQAVYPARRSFVEPEHPLYDAQFEWQPLP